MSEDKDTYESLMRRLDHLLDRQNDLVADIMEVRSEVKALKAEGDPAVEESAESNETIPPPVSEDVPKPSPPVRPRASSQDAAAGKPVRVTPKAKKGSPKQKAKSDLEGWIGRNLINKVGIAITVIGVAIGVKYSIDHNLVSPAMRMIFGYLTGGALLAAGYWLRSRYENYSAVLVSGGIAIMYLVTFSAYNFFGLIPQEVAFGIMVLLTGYGIYTAISYNLEIIAHIGLVGAYAVPLLLSDGSGRVEVLFSYVAIINAGILVLAFRKNWINLNYSSLVITWILYVTWLSDGYESEQHFSLALIFLTITFLTFYAMFLSYKVIKRREFLLEDVFLLLGNSLLYFMICHSLIDDYPPAEAYLGVFALANGFVHLLASIILYRRSVDVKVFYFAAGLAATFITIAIPIELDGNMVTLLWSVEGAILFAIGRYRKAAFYEMFSYPLLLCAFFSLALDWSTHYGRYSFNTPQGYLIPILNIQFLTSMVYTLSVGAVVFIMRKYEAFGSGRYRKLADLFGVLLILVLIFAAYNMFRLEISNTISQAYNQALIAADKLDNGSPYGKVDNPFEFNIIMQFAYTVVFVTSLAFINLKRIKKKELYKGTVILHYITVAFFLLVILYCFGLLRDDYQRGLPPIMIAPRNFALYGRYFVMALVVGSTLMARRQIRQFYSLSSIPNFFILSVHVTILWTISSELIHWLDLAGYDATYKLALSILWGCYAVLLIVLGIRQNRKVLRISAFILFGITLLKVFVYDLESLDTVSKTIVFISLGVLLLITSFLYNKYKDVLMDDDASEAGEAARAIPSESRQESTST